MLDYRIETFLTLCEEKSYTKTAKRLCITQPAVSQHIRYLEQYYGVDLFIIKGKNLILTEKGELFKKYSLLSKAEWLKVTALMREETAVKHVNFGATLTIGEYVMPDILEMLMNDSSGTAFTMLVDNTQTLLDKLSGGLIDFAFIEGQFDQKEYITRLFLTADFIPVCSKEHGFAKRSVHLSEIFKERLIVREKGSGTRGVLEQVLLEHNHNIDSFSKITEIGNLNVIKNMVKKNLGIAFLYKDAVREELLNNSLIEIDLRDFAVKREYHFVCLKDSHFTDENLKLFDLCQKYRRIVN
ncbi:MAG: transcriptional regulator, LysR family [Anaerocolumna sp.]|jgi:DNA-binding transcriptional LysR family regulator|nr:transcriptional regulator, LysR family [Anaerocolumna sp.]